MSDKRWSINIFKSKDRNIILICIGIAFILWLTTKLSKDYIQEYRFDLNFELPQNEAFVSAPPDRMRASLSGQGWELLQASFKRKFKQLPVIVTHTDISRSDLIQALYEHIGDHDVQVREVSLEFFQLDTDIKQQKSVPVIYQSQVTAAEGFILVDSLRMTPDHVTVVGPASVLETISYVTIDVGTLGELEANTTRKLAIADLPPFIEADPEEIEVSASVDETIAVAVRVPVRISGGAPGTQIDPDHIDIRVTTGKTIASQVNASTVKAFVDLSSHKGLEIAQIHVELPPNAYNPEYTPVYVAVRVDSSQLNNN